MQQLINSLQKQYEWLNFEAGKRFCWSPKNKSVSYRENSVTPEAKCSLLHEVSHAILHHARYNDDFDLLQLEVAAWRKTFDLAKEYDIDVSEDYVEDCLDTYRDWLHLRSTCPSCGQNSLQDTKQHYRCFNCHNHWQVSSSRLCRTYRLNKQQSKVASAT